MYVARGCKQLPEPPYSPRPKARSCNGAREHGYTITFPTLVRTDVTGPNVGAGSRASGRAPPAHASPRPWDTLAATASRSGPAAPTPITCTSRTTACTTARAAGYGQTRPTTPRSGVTSSTATRGGPSALRAVRKNARAQLKKSPARLTQRLARPLCGPQGWSSQRARGPV